MFIGVTNEDMGRSLTYLVAPEKNHPKGGFSKESRNYLQLVIHLTA